jgi:pimeloyl-ACP methyl ester carboxylesterase
VRLEVEELGRSGGTVLLIHGLGVSGGLLAGTAERLAEGRRVLLPDLRGHGRSSAGPPRELDDYASDLVPLLRANAPAALVGISFGSLVACRLWRLAPEAVEAVVLFDPTLDPRPLLRWAAAEAERRGTGIERVVFEPYLVRDEGRLLETLARFPLAAELDAAGRLRVARATLECDGPTLRATLPLLRDAATPVRPAETGVPLTLLRARDGIVCPAAAAEAWARENGAAVVELPCGHQAPVNAPELLAAAIDHALA